MADNQFVVIADGERHEYDSRQKAEQAHTTAKELGQDAELILPDTDGEAETQLTEVAEVDAIAIDRDPVDTLPGWMIDRIERGGQSSPHLNKRGCQVIARYLGLDVRAEPVERAADTAFEYAEYSAYIAGDDGDRTYESRGFASIEEDGIDAHNLDLQAETRAKKRAVKWATGGGIEAFDR